MKGIGVVLFVSTLLVTDLIPCGYVTWGQSQASKSKLSVLGVKEILEAFRTAGLPIDNEIIYTAENDPNRLLGRPHQYIAKASWADKRIEQALAGDVKGGTVEAFDSRESLERRKKYVDDVGKAVPMLIQYQFVHKNILLRLERELTPKQAGEYERVLNRL